MDVRGQRDHFDRKILLDFLEGDEDLMNSLIDLVIAKTPGHIDELSRAAQMGNATEVQRLGHTIKGSAANLCAEGLRELAWQAEQAGRSGDLARARFLLPRIRQEFETIRQSLSSQHPSS